VSYCGVCDSIYCPHGEKENKMTYKNIEALGLTVYGEKDWTAVKAIELEALFESAQTVYGFFKEEAKGSKMPVYVFNDQHDGHETHTAKLIMVKPIRKGVSRDDIFYALKVWVDSAYSESAKALLKRIETEGIINE
jgi:hypothetical protein